MKVYQLLQSFTFDELIPEISKMFPNSRLHTDVFESAFNMLCAMKPVMSKKAVRYQLMDDPDSNDVYAGADDSCFNTTWEGCLGKDIKKEKGVDLNETELAANILLNILLIGKHPKTFDSIFAKLYK